MSEKRGEVILGIFAVLFIALINLSSASFQLGTPSNSIQIIYEQGEKISGWLNISFTDQELNQTFNDNFGNSVSLETLLNKNPNYLYTNINSTINSTTQILYLNNSFSIPNIVGNLSFKLNFSNQELLSHEINLESGENLTLKIIVSRKIIEKETDITNYKKGIGDYDLLVQKKLNQTFNADNMQSQINTIKSEYASAQEDADYYEVLEKLNSLKIPKSIIISKSADNIIFVPSEEIINVEVLARISGGEYSGNEDSYIQGISFWSQSELDSRITFKEISVNYGSSEEYLYSYFELIFPSEIPTESYLIIKKMQDIEFGEDYSYGEEGNYFYLALDNFNGDKITFVTSEEVDFIDVPLFISPALEDIPRTEIGEYTEGEKQMSVSKWIFFGLLLLLLIVLTGVVYTVIQAWYDKKYENYLFPNRNNLYNLIIYINNSKKRGVKDEEIIKNLKESKWTQEQIRYVMRKYAGKRTGMMKIFSKKEAIPKRNINPNIHSSQPQKS